MWKRNTKEISNNLRLLVSYLCVEHVILFTVLFALCRDSTHLLPVFIFPPFFNGGYLSQAAFQPVPDHACMFHKSSKSIHECETWLSH